MAIDFLGSKKAKKAPRALKVSVSFSAPIGMALAIEELKRDDNLTTSEAVTLLIDYGFKYKDVVIPDNLTRVQEQQKLDQLSVAIQEILTKFPQSEAHYNNNEGASND